MEIGIIGLPRSGKTTIFNAVTRGNANVASFSDKPNVGMAKVPDERLGILANMYNPRRVVPAEMRYTDLPPPSEGLDHSRGIAGEYLNTLQSVDALLLIIRAFENPSVPHIDETVEPLRDAENMLLELIFSDLEILDRRLSKIKESFKGAKHSERESLQREQDLLDKIKNNLDDGIALRDQALQSKELKHISGFGLLSYKPLIVVINVSEDQLTEKVALENKLSETILAKQIKTVAICAELEMNLSQMSPDEEWEFRKDLAIGESSLNQIIRLSYEVVDQISFFTVGEDEVRAWEVPRNTVAQRAAGKIHSDLERGFIRAEVISYKHLVDSGGLGAARKLGLLRQEGKEYVLQDGEIMHVLFNV